MLKLRLHKSSIYLRNYQ